MLAMDTTGLDEAALKKAVVDYLSPFGEPAVVMVVPRENGREYAVVAVKMQTAEDARRLARSFGHMRYGSIVVIRLAQPGARRAGAANEAAYE